MLKLAITNESTLVTYDAFTAAVAAFRTQIQRDFSPLWGISAQLYVPVTPGYTADWVVRLVDDMAQADELGYTREVTARPEAFICVKDAQDAGFHWTVSASHEILETLADPWSDCAIQINATEFAGLEVCDPVQSDNCAYRINMTQVSNFILPSWFHGGSDGPWDFRGVLSAPLSLGEGGYASLWDPSTGWTQIVSDGLTRASESYRHNLRENKDWGDWSIQA